MPDWNSRVLYTKHELQLRHTRRSGAYKISEIARIFMVRLLKTFSDFLYLILIEYTFYFIPKRMRESEFLLVVFSIKIRISILYTTNHLYYVYCY